MTPRRCRSASRARALWPVLFLLLAGRALGSPRQEDHHHHAPAPAPGAVPAAPATEPLTGLEIPDTPLRDQEGRPVRFYSDLVRGKRVAINFIFTTCTTICPPIGATFGKLRALLGERAGRDVHLISVSVDPANDTPARLRAWSERFGAGPGWTLVTGEKAEVTALLKALGVFTPSLADHSPLVLLGDDPAKEWTRAYGLASPARLAELIDHMGGVTGMAGGAKAAADSSGSPSPPISAAQHYFGDISLVDQDGRPRRLYSDLLQGKIVVIDVMFTSCAGSCPVLSRNLERIQESLGERVGRDVHLLSFSVDPTNDTPARLKEYAERYHARPGWYFLTGEKADVEAALRKLGQQVERPEAHQNLLLIGNEPTGLWKKAFGLADPAAVLEVVDSVVRDRG